MPPITAIGSISDRQVDKLCTAGVATTDALRQAAKATSVKDLRSSDARELESIVRL